MNNDRNYRVLIVDDAIYMRWKIKKIFEADPELTVAGEGAHGIEAVSLARQLDPDIITLDITMPEMNGIDATTEIRKFNERAKIVMISALGQKSKIMACLQAGADFFLLKPFTDDGLLRMMERLKSRVEPSG